MKSKINPKQAEKEYNKFKSRNKLKGEKSLKQKATYINKMDEKNQ